MSLDISKLEKVKNKGAYTIARCPGCAELGRDRKGEHLWIANDGRFGCVIFPGESGKEHRKRIFYLVGEKCHYETPTPKNNTILVKTALSKQPKTVLFKDILGHLGRFTETYAGKNLCDNYSPPLKKDFLNAVPNVPKSRKVSAVWIEKGKVIDMEVIRKLYHLGLEWNKGIYKHN